MTELKIRLKEIEERAQRMCDNDVYCRQNSTVDKFAEDDDWRNEVANYEVYDCPECGERLPHDESEYEATEEEQDDEYDSEGELVEGKEGHGCTYTCPSCKKGFDDPDHDYAEVYEWWAVSNYLAEKLKEAGEVVWDGPDVMCWGRTCTGQAIMLDGTLQDIVRAIDRGLAEQAAVRKAWKAQNQ